MNIIQEEFRHKKVFILDSEGFRYRKVTKMKIQATKNATKVMLAVALMSVALLGVAATALSTQATTRTSALAFHDAMRKLWEDHITWTRLVIVSVVNDLPDTGNTVNRLLSNQEDIGNAIKPFYGEAAGNQLTALLHDHITIAAEILNAAKASDNDALNDALNRWYDNANDIATFLSSANPKNWPVDMMKDMMKTHLDLTLQEAVAYLQGNYAGSTAAYEEIHVQILDMADMLSTGIIHQFPGKFTGSGMFIR